VVFGLVGFKIWFLVTLVQGTTMVGTVYHSAPVHDTVFSHGHVVDGATSEVFLGPVMDRLDGIPNLDQMYVVLELLFLVVCMVKCRRTSCRINSLCRDKVVAKYRNNIVGGVHPHHIIVRIRTNRLVRGSHEMLRGAVVLVILDMRPCDVLLSTSNMDVAASVCASMSMRQWMILVLMLPRTP
jgi:hypothetical protein